MPDIGDGKSTVVSDTPNSPPSSGSFGASPSIPVSGRIGFAVASGTLTALAGVAVALPFPPWSWVAAGVLAVAGVVTAALGGATVDPSKLEGIATAVANQVQAQKKP